VRAGDKTEDTHFPAYGAQTVHMLGEVYVSLQTSVVNVAENGINVRQQALKWRC
jgi:TRAP-type C4-dicarboxylate transport system substrate-binding protein